MCTAENFKRVQRIGGINASIGEAIEGAATALVALELASRHGVELPICREVAAVVRGEKVVAQAMAALLSRPLRSEAASGR